MTAARPPSVLRPAIVYAVLSASVGAYFPYIAVFFRSIGLPLEAVGLLTALNAGIALVAAPVWGALADHLRDVRGPLVAAGFWSAAAAALLAVARDPLQVAAAVVLLAAGSAGIGPMLDSRTVEILGDHRDRFGHARAWASASFIVCSLLVGALLDRTGPGGLFIVFVPALALTALTVQLLLGGGRPGERLPVSRRAVRLSPLSGLSGILGRPVLAIFLLGSVLVWTSVTAVSTFLSIHLVTLGADASIVGLTWALGAVVEVPLMLLFPRLVRRVGAERLLVVGAVFYAARAIGWAIAPVPALIVAMAPLGGVGFALFYVGTVSYVSRAAPRDAQATALAVFSGTASGLGTIVGSIAGGAIATAVSLPVMFAIAAVGTVGAAAVVWYAIESARGPGRRAFQPAGGGQSLSSSSSAPSNSGGVEPAPPVPEISDVPESS